MKKIYYDFHLHSCLSPCADDDNTPNNIVNMAKLKGLDAIAVSDHNTVGNCRAAMEVGRKNGLLVLCAMELETSEEVHVLCLFNTLEDGERFEKYVNENMLKLPLNKKFYGNELLLDKNDNLISEKDYLLSVSTAISVMDITRLMDEYNGAAIPAHADKGANSIISNLGFISDEMHFKTLEISKNITKKDFITNYGYAGYQIISNSDAHYLWDINERENFLLADEISASCIINRLKSC